MAGFSGFIDPPLPFDPPEAWRAYLVKLEKIEPKSDEVRSAIDEAKEHLKEIGAAT